KAGMEAATAKRRPQCPEKNRNAKNAGEHPEQGQQPPEPTDGNLVAKAGRGHRHRRPPHAISNALQRARVEILGIVPPLQQPDERPDKKQDAEQRRDGREQLVAEKAGKRSQHAALRLRMYGDAETGGKIRVRIVETRLALDSDRDCRDRGVDLMALDGVQKPGKIVVVFAKLELQLQLGCDLVPQLNAQPAPFSVVAAQYEG